MVRPSGRNGGRGTPGFEGFRDLMQEMLHQQEERIMGNIQAMLGAQKEELEDKMKQLFEENVSTRGTPHGEDGPSYESMHRGDGRGPSEIEEDEREEAIKVRCSFKSFNGCDPPTYDGAPDPLVLHKWVIEMELAFSACQCLDNQRTNLAVTKLRDDALQWWIDFKETTEEGEAEHMNWGDFLEKLKERFCTQEEIRQCLLIQMFYLVGTNFRIMMSFEMF